MPLINILASARDRLHNAKRKVAQSSGPLLNPTQSEVDTELTAAQSDIAAALVEINNAGTADTSALPNTLPGIAAACFDLTTHAHKEAMEGVPDETLIGDRIKTADWMIDTANGYRDLAGL